MKENVVENVSDGYICNIDYVEYFYDKKNEKGSIYIQGWTLKKGKDMDKAKISLVVYDGNEYKKIPTYRQIREDVMEHFSDDFKDGVDYRNSGFYIYTSDVYYGIPTDDITYELYVMVETDDGVKYINPNYIIEPSYLEID